jgi:hypothetical protein
VATAAVFASDDWIEAVAAAAVLATGILYKGISTT